MKKGKKGTMWRKVRVPKLEEDRCEPISAAKRAAWKIIRTAGQRAYEAGVTRWVNPHPTGTDEWASWDNGWSQHLINPRLNRKEMMAL